MDVVDQSELSWASAADSAGEREPGPEETVDGRQEEAGEDAAAGSPDTSSEADGPAAGPRAALDTRAIAAWRTALERAGFSPAEAERLIFERMRPRGEGTARSA